jgi:membrane protein
MFTRLPRISQPIKKVFKAALFGAVGFEILKFAGAYYVARTTTKGQATYGTFAVVVGLLLFLNLVSRLILMTAAFAVTKPYDSDALPSGTATPEQARKAGIPTEYADNDDPEHPPVLQDDGAPTPLQAAVEGQRPPKDEPAGDLSATAAYPETPFRPVPAPEDAPSAQGLRGEAAVRTAGRAGGAMIGMVLVAVAIYALRTLRTVLVRG